MKRIPTLTEVVAVALIDADRRVLLQQRQPGKQHGGLWEFPGGKVEAGETALFALVREIKEELGIRIAADRLSLLDQAADPDGGLVIALYTCLVWDGAPHCLDAAALGWFTPHEMRALPMPPLDVPLAAALEEWLQGR